MVVIDAFSTSTDRDPGVGTAGYTEMTDLFVSDNNSVNFSVSYKLMGATPDTTVSCNGNVSSPTFGSACVVYVWRGVNPVTPMDVASTTATSASSASPNCASITPVTTGAVVMCTSAMASANVSTASTSPATPAGIGGSTWAAVDPGSAITAMAVYGNWSSGAYDPAAWTITAGTASQDSWAALTLALRPIPPARKIRLFEGYTIKLNGKIILRQQ